jgi:dTDP-4-amino-4,6-dideoxygalactose transaminase
VKNRDGLKAHLQSRGIPSVIYYVKPLHSQVAYRNFPRTPLGLPVSESLPERILCLPMHPYLSETDQDLIIAAVRVRRQERRGGITGIDCI